MKKSLLIGAFFAAAVVAVPTTVGAATTVTVDTTGPKSLNKVIVGAVNGAALKVKIKNNTNANLAVTTAQGSQTGNAKVKYNTDAGSAETGAAGNTNDLIGDLVVTNTNDPATCGCGTGDVTVTVEDTGFLSKNIVKVKPTTTKVKVANNTNVNATNQTVQEAASGNAKVTGNTNGGDATTGDATNDNVTDLVVDVANDNSGVAAACGCQGGDVDVLVSNTGPLSKNIVKVGGSGSSVKIQNNTNLNVLNNTVQNATTGNAKVSGNTNGGSATTGNASNTNSTSLSFSVSNTN